MSASLTIGAIDSLAQTVAQLVVEANPDLETVLTNGNTTGGTLIDATGGNIYCDALKCVSLEALGAPINNNIGVDGNLTIVDGGELLFNSDVIIRGNQDGGGTDVIVDAIPEAEAPLSNVVSYDTETNKLYYQPAGGSAGVETVSGIGYIDAIGSTDITISLKTYQPENVIYVSQNAGDDDDGDGTELLPYATIQKAVDLAEARASNSYLVAIVVGPGGYTENLTFTKGYITLTTSLTDPQATRFTQINGSIGISCENTGTTTTQRLVISGFTISGSITDDSVGNHSLHVNNCYFDSESNCILVDNTNGATDCRVYLDNNIFVRDTSSPYGSVHSTYGWLSIMNCQFTTSSNDECLVVAGTCYLNKCALTQFESSHTGSSPIVSITSTSSLNHAIGQCTFAYTNASGKVDGTSCAVSLTRPNVQNVLLLQNFYSLVGTTSAGNAIEITGASGTIVVGNGGNLGVPLYATALDATGSTEVAMTTVPSAPLPSDITCSSLTSSIVKTGNITQPSITFTGAPQSLTITASQIYNNGIYINLESNGTQNLTLPTASQLLALVPSGNRPCSFGKIELNSNGVQNPAYTTTIVCADAIFNGRSVLQASDNALITFYVDASSNLYVNTYLSGKTPLSGRATFGAGVSNLTIDMGGTTVQNMMGSNPVILVSACVYQDDSSPILPISYFVHNPIGEGRRFIKVYFTGTQPNGGVVCWSIMDTGV